jgi:hypothetical protein
MKNRQRPHVAESARPDFVTYMQIVTFCVLLILAGCGKSADDLATVGAVQRVIVTDASLHVQYMAELKAAYERYSAPFKDPSIKPMCAYSDRLEGIDLRGCPPQFQEAFISWCQSRRDLERLSISYDGVTGALGGMFELATSHTDPYVHFKAQEAIIDERWAKVETIALKYGVHADPHSE